MSIFSHHEDKKVKILFVLKHRSSYGVSFGLLNSCIFVHNALNDINVESKVVSVIDANCIDREIHKYKPTHCVIEALYATPAKVKELLKLHRNVEFNVRLHSKTSFLIEEGIAFEWIKEYHDLSVLYSNFSISSNNTDLITELDKSLSIKLKYTPNIYKPKSSTDDDTEIIRCWPWDHEDKKRIIHVSSFGAVRVLKNTGIQALAALEFANSINKQLYFHINSSRVERGGEPILKNLRNIFKNSYHKLIEHGWMNHYEFIQLVKKIDIGMQVSMSESFNIVSADFVWNNIPIVGSEEIAFLTPESQADVTNISDIVDKLKRAYRNIQIGSNILQKKNKKLLEKSNKQALKDWKKFLDL